MTATGPLRELAVLFLRLGVTAFGGPAAHIATMRDEVVDRRRWLTDKEFLDLVAATNLIPGPNSTELAIHNRIRHRRRFLMLPESERQPACRREFTIVPPITFDVRPQLVNPPLPIRVRRCAVLWAGMPETPIEGATCRTHGGFGSMG